MPVMIFDGWWLVALFFPAKDLFFSDIIRKGKGKGKEEREVRC